MHARALILCCALPAVLPAQERQLPVLTKFSVPLHEAPDDPIAGAYGTWGAGHDYKVSFQDGFRFFPRLGPAAPRNLPLGWRTEAIRFGKEPLFEGGARTGGRDGDWRYQLRHPGVVESYELRADALEQSFTILTAPATGGDLTIDGVLETELVPKGRSLDESVQFVDRDRVARLTLGSAVAVDADDHTIPVQRTLEGGRLRLLVRAADLVRVRFPITIRQVTTAVVVLQAHIYSDVDLTHWLPDIYLVVTSHSAAFDADSYGFRISESGSLHLFWADITTAWSTEHPRVECGPTAFLRLAGQRTHASPARSEIFLYTQLVPPPAGLNLGDWAWAPVTAGYTQRKPEIDPDMVHGTVLVWQEDFTSTNADTPTTRICAAPYRPQTNSFLVKWIVAEGVLFDTESPVMGGGMVFWQHQPNLNFLPPEIHARALDGNGPLPGPDLLVSSAHAGHACRHPRVSKRSLIYAKQWLCAYEFTQGGDHGFGAVLFELGTVVQQRELWRSSQPCRLHDVAILSTRHHWHVLAERAGTLQVERLGRTGGSVQVDTIHSGTAGTACLGPVGMFTFYSRSSVPDQLMRRTLMLSPDAATSTYGDTCGGTLSNVTIGYGEAQAFAGGEVLLNVIGPDPGTLCQLWIALGKGSTPLFGGCTFLLDSWATVLMSFSFTPVEGLPVLLHLLNVPLPDDPVFFGDLYCQVTWADPTFPAITRATNGVELRVR